MELEVRVQQLIAGTIEFQPAPPLRVSILDRYHEAMSHYLYPLASLPQVEKTPSREDGIPESLEEDLRACGCKLIHQAGILLRQYVPPSLYWLMSELDCGR